MKNKCKQCGTTIVKSSPKANNLKYCSKKCYNIYIYAHKKARGIDSNLQSKIRTAQYAEGKIQCAICKGWYIKLCAHTVQAHGVTASEYKKEQRLDSIKGLVHKDHHKKLSELVKKHPTVIQENLVEGGKATRFKKGDKTLGNYQRSEQTLKRLKRLK